MIESPCIGICTLDATDVCVGCGRRLDEIARWSAMSDAEQRTVVALAESRLAAQPSGESGG